ncbi:MAG: hypothetical protein ACRECH_10250 [Nitrososphaerales archaeon]
MGQSIISSRATSAFALISVSKDEEARRASKSRVDSIAHHIFEFADESVGHAENVPKEELMLACYHELGKLLSQWGKKLDKIRSVAQEPQWLKEYLARKESTEGRSRVAYDSFSFGFALDNLFFGKEESFYGTLSDDLLMISEPRTMLMEDFNELLKFCDSNGLDFYVDGFNTSLPGRTFRVVVYKPKSGSPRRHLDFRENALVALQLFRELSATPGGSSVAIERGFFIDAYVKRTGGTLDPVVASKILDALISSGQIPQSRIT